MSAATVWWHYAVAYGAAVVFFALGAAMWCADDFAVANRTVSPAGLVLILAGLLVLVGAIFGGVV